jgi:hypothetical protein
MEPDVGERDPARIFNNEDFPMPESPMITTRPFLGKV